ncbi:hypothetical protein AVMA1855_17095 [Acidovorax sp. SUPP1855]|uniref:hypothetical protein n=1 Tax=Acidovorax sp. SUPP1855 TaxID=431774 RepID=UPI0023DE2ACB|nr:hypothetical protein [Acidovorax sp. SUPP1855]GKS85893.1 hypothetical protein AVMA1855_17095 [Acidovorax sp. SUPP1855]
MPQMHIALVEFGQFVDLNARDKLLASDIYRPACSLSAEQQFQADFGLLPNPPLAGSFSPKAIGSHWRGVKTRSATWVGWRMICCATAA